MDKRRPQLDSACQIRLRSHSREFSDCSFDGLYGGKTCWGGIPRTGTEGNVFNGGATTSSRKDQRTPRLDSARQIGLRSHHHGILTLVDDGLYGG